MTSFDWDQKDIKNLKQSPESLFTPIVLWFWINSQYFPFNAQITAEQSFDTLFESILQQNLPPQIRQNQSLDYEEVGTEDEPSLVSKLQIEENFRKMLELLNCAEQKDKDVDTLLSRL